MIQVKLIAKSDILGVHHSVEGMSAAVRTFELTYPRFIHSELMTHRVFSRNAASSRAIPVKRMIELAKEYSTCPETFYKNQAGMEADEPLNDEDQRKARNIWHNAMLDTCNAVEALIDTGVHKQWANRLLEPYAHITTIVTCNQMEGFYNLRRATAEDSSMQPEIAELAEKMWQQDSTTVAKPNAPFHLPYVEINLAEYFGKNGDAMKSLTLLNVCEKIIPALAKISRVSYMRTLRETSFVDDCRQVVRLWNDGKPHASCFEHFAFTPIHNHPLVRGDNLATNFACGVLQLRHMPELMRMLISSAQIQIDADDRGDNRPLIEIVEHELGVYDE